MKSDLLRFLSFLLLVYWITVSWYAYLAVCNVLVVMCPVSHVILFTCCFLSRKGWMWLALLPLFLVWIACFFRVVSVPLLIYLVCDISVYTSFPKVIFDSVYDMSVVISSCFVFVQIHVDFLRYVVRMLILDHCFLYI